MSVYIYCHLHNIACTYKVVQTLFVYMGANVYRRDTMSKNDEFNQQ